MNPFNLFDFSFFLLLKPVRNHKLEKADILEMTVKHLRNLQKQKLASKLKFDFKNIIDCFWIQKILIFRFIT